MNEAHGRCLSNHILGEGGLSRQAPQGVHVLISQLVPFKIPCELFFGACIDLWLLVGHARTGLRRAQTPKPVHL